MKTFQAYILTHGGVNPRDVRHVGTVRADDDRAAWEEAARRYGHLVTGKCDMLVVS